jgi:hypothetical protein
MVLITIAVKMSVAVAEHLLQPLQTRHFWLLVAVVELEIIPGIHLA